jgi:hypothetical protein
LYARAVEIGLGPESRVAEVEALFRDLDRDDEKRDAS